ncbi:hypothetical protein EDB80DRAFT_778210 [Ilyonectria destructans]|nr:hypothetical protein EDB80DRAFT_778210 [Ilyonectria destructans]
MKFSVVALTSILAAVTQAQNIDSIGDIASSVIADASTLVDGALSSVTESAGSEATSFLATVTGETTTVGTSSASNTQSVDSSIIPSDIGSLSTILQTASGSPTISVSSESDSASGGSETATSSGNVQSTSTGDGSGAMPTAAVAMGALMGGAAILANM